MAEQTHDNVNSPSHYTSGKIEVWDFIKDQGLHFDRGSAVKYICRAGKKKPENGANATPVDVLRKEIEDMEKARAFIDHDISALKQLLVDLLEDVPRSEEEKFVQKAANSLRRDNVRS